MLQKGAQMPQSDEVRQMMISIGRRLRSARSERGLTLREVARSSSLTAAFISQLERGETSASVTSLVRITSALGIDLASLFEMPSSTLVRRSERVPTMLGGEGVLDYILTPRAEKRTQVIETHVDPGGYPDTELYSRGGELVVCVVQSGTLEMRIADERTLLRAGDAITFDGKIPHTWRNPSQKQPTHLLWVSVPAEL